MPEEPAERIRIKRIYRAARVSDGKRVLVDRLWPRGVAKDRARLYVWKKEIAPSDDLRRWFHENPDRWEEFSKHYRQELEDKNAEISDIAALAKSNVVTLLFAAKDEDHNNAVVLQQVLQQHLQQGD